MHCGCRTHEVKFIGLHTCHRASVFSTGLTMRADCQEIVGLLMAFLQAISEFSLLQSHLGNLIIEATILTAQQRFIFLSCSLE